MKKKLSLFVLLFVLSVNAFAFIPLLITGARLVAAGIATPTGQLYAAGTVMAIGTLAQSVYFSRLGTDSSTRTDTLYTTSSPRPASAQEAAAGFTAGYPHVTPASTSTQIPGGYRATNTTGSFANPVLACNVDVTYLQSHGYPNAVAGNDAAGDGPYGGYCSIYTYLNSGSKIGNQMYWTVTPSCNPGYTVSGANCNLSAPDSVVRPLDGFCPIVRSGTTYSVDTTDPDCTGSFASANPTFAADGTFSISSADGHTMAGTGFTAGGVGTIVDTQPMPDGTTKKTTTTLQGTASPTTTPPVVSGVSQETFAGTGAGVGTTPIAPPAAPAAPVDLSPVTAAQAVTTAAIQAQAAADAAARTQDAADTATAAAAVPSMTAAHDSTTADSLASLTTLQGGLPTQYQNDENSIANMFHFAPVASACAPWSKTIHGHTATIDLCTYTEMIRTLLGWLFGLFGAYTSFQTITRPKA